MSKRRAEAIWYENLNRWQINIQNDGIRKTFTSSIPGRRGKADAERQADHWLDDATTAEKARLDSLLDQYEAWLDDTKSTGHASQYKGFVRLYIRPIIGHLRINKLTEADLQDVIDRAYVNHSLADKTLRDTATVRAIKTCDINSEQRQVITVKAGRPFFVQRKALIHGALRSL